MKIWDIETGQQVHSLTGHRDYVRSLAFSPDGHSLVSGDRGGSLRVWRVASGRPVCELEKLSAEIRRIAFSPDGRKLACQLKGKGHLVVLDVAPVAEEEARSLRWRILP